MVVLVREGLGNGDGLIRRLAGGIPGGSAGLAGGVPVILSWPSFFLPLFHRRKEKTQPLSLFLRPMHFNSNGRQ
jgi:hypothetical protein